MMLEQAAPECQAFRAECHTRLEVRFRSSHDCGVRQGSDPEALLTVAAAVERVRARQRGRDGRVRVLVAVGVAAHLILRI